MASTKRFITYKCNTCKRTKDFLADDLHSFINLCTITQHCPGKLAPIATKNIRSILASNPIAGVLDWLPKEAPPEVSNKIIPKTFLLDNSFSQVMCIAVKNSGQTLPTDFNLTFTVQKTNVQEFTEYVYNLGANQDTIIGADISSQAKVLKFTNTDNVSVYINGVQTEDISVKYSDSVGYAIVLNTTRNVISNIRVVVYPRIDISETATINFVKNNALILSKTTAWSNINSIILNGHKYILYSSVLNMLPANKELNLYPGNALNDLVLSDMYFLLSNNPFTSIDRILTFVVPLNVLTTPDLWVKNYVDSSTKHIQVSYQAVEQITSPIDVTLIAAETVVINSIATEEVTPLPVNTNILGVA